MKATKRPSPEETIAQWYLVNAKGLTLGRLATGLAKVLMGKHQARFDPSVPANTKVVVINASQIKVTGRKLEQKVYYHHSGYPGGLKEIVLEELMKKKPTEVLRRAVDGMLPKNKLRRGRIASLKIYLDDQHKHDSHKPTNLTF